MTEAVADFRSLVRMDSQNSHARLNVARALAAADELPEFSSKHTRRSRLLRR